MEVARSYTKGELENKKYSELQKISKALGIKGGRLKTDKLIEAILEIEVPDSLSEDAGNIATALAEAAVKEEEESVEVQSVKTTDTSDLLADIDFPDDDLLGALEATPAKTPGRPTKNGHAVATPQSSMKKRGRSAFLDNGNEVTPDASSNDTKRRRTESFEDDEISFPNFPCQVDDEISFPKVVASENEEKVAENSQQLALLVRQLPSLTPAQVSKRRRGRGRKPVLGDKDKTPEKSSQITQEITNTFDIKMPHIRRESTFDKETSDLAGDVRNNSEIMNQSIVREGTFVKDEENKTLVRENTFTKDEPENKNTTEKIRNDDLEKTVETIDDDIVTSDCVTEFVADTEESSLSLPNDDIVTSDCVTEFVAQPTVSETPKVASAQLENISVKAQVTAKKSRSIIATPKSARKSLASGSTPGINRKSITISRRSVATPLNANNVRKSIGVMGINVSNLKKDVGVSTPAGAKILTPVTKTSLARKSIGTPMAKIVTPVTKINSGRKSIGSPLAGRKFVGKGIQLGQKSTSKEKPVEASNIITSTVPSKLVKPTFSIGRTAPSKTEQTHKQAGSGIPRFVSYARKIKMPDFSKIHERAFKKMDALDDYQDKKHRRTRTVTAGKGTPKARTPVASTAPAEAFTPSVTKVKNVNLNFTKSAANKETPNNAKSPKNVRKTPTNSNIFLSGKKNSTKKVNNSASKNTSKSPKLVTKSSIGNVSKAIKSPKVISTKSPKISSKSPKVAWKSPKTTASNPQNGKSTASNKPQNGKKDVTRSGIPTLKENVKPDPKSSSQLASKIPAPKPVNYQPYTGAMKPIQKKNTIEDRKKMAMKNPNIKSSLQIRAGQRSILNGVRINKRFELQMAKRGIDLQLDN